MGADDRIFLARREVFNLPELPLRNELLRKYAEYVHPLLPLLDLADFLKAIDSDDGQVQISLMLVYTVLAAAASFLEDSLLQAAGFLDRNSARKALFQRAKVRMIVTYFGDS